MILSPYGLANGQVPDTTEFARDFWQAHSLLQETNQYRFARNTFTAARKISEDFCKIHRAKCLAQLGANPLNPPDLTKATGNPKFYWIPYNRGLDEVTSPDEDYPEWTTQYPEMLMIMYQFQYCRADNSTWNVTPFGTWETSVNVRALFRIAVNGSQLPGSGPMGLPVDASYRGTGLSERSAMTTIRALTFVPAGSHRVSVLAGQNPCVVGASDDYANPVSPFDAGDGPTDQVVVGNRVLTLIRFAGGKQVKG